MMLEQLNDNTLEQQTELELLAVVAQEAPEHRLKMLPPGTLSIWKIVIIQKMGQVLLTTKMKTGVGLRDPNHGTANVLRGGSKPCPHPLAAIAP